MTNSENTIFPKGDPAPADYFTGTTWLSMLLPNDTTLNCQVGNVTFEAGARNNWHTHSGGQILLVTDGIGYYQEQGNAIREIRKGDIIKILPHVVHWHGASHNTAMTHIAINPNTQHGMVTWLQRVTDEEYNSVQ